MKEPENDTKQPLRAEIRPRNMGKRAAMTAAITMAMADDGVTHRWNPHATSVDQMGLDQAAKANRHFGSSKDQAVGLEAFIQGGLYERDGRFQVYQDSEGNVHALELHHRGVTPFMTEFGQSRGICDDKDEFLRRFPGGTISSASFRRPSLEEMDVLKKTDEPYWDHCKKGGLMLVAAGADVKKMMKRRPVRVLPKPGRNQPCDCGSGLKVT